MNASVTVRPSVNHNLSGDTAGFNTSTIGSMVDVTNTSVTITTSGRPVIVMLVGDNNGTSGSGSFSSGIKLGSGSTWYVTLLRDSTVVHSYELVSDSTTTSRAIPPYYDNPSAGSYTYKIQVYANSGSGNINISNMKLLVYEL